MEVLAWDLECGSLSADFGLILCAGLKTIGKGKVEVLNILDYLGKDRDIIKAERRLLIDVSGRLLEADVWVYHFGTHYDLPFINSRLLYHRLPVLPPKFPAIDTWKVSRNRLKLHNNRLATISEFFGTDNEKNAIKGDQWIRALAGHKPSMDYVVKHCELDCLVLEQVYNILRPLILDHPNKGLIDGRGGCSVCGEQRLQKRGYHVTRTRKYQRYQCMDCGAWSKGTKPVASATTN